MHQAIFFSLLIGIPVTIIFELFPNFLLNLFFKTNRGIPYIRVLAPICLFHYIQSPISSTLQAMKKAKLSLKGTLYGMIIRTISLFAISYLNIGLWSLVIATSINIIFVTVYNYIKVKQELKNIP